MNLDDELTFTISVREAIRVYAGMGIYNGVELGVSLWAQLKKALDPNQRVYNAVILPINSDIRWNYQNYQKRFENSILMESDQYKQRVELEGTREALLQQLAQVDQKLEALK